MNAISCSWSYLVKFIPLVPDVLLLLLHGRLLGVEVVPRPGQNLPAGHHLSPGQSNLCLGRAGHHPPPQADQLRQGFANSVILLFTYFHFTTSISQTLKRVKVRFYGAVALLHKIHKTFGMLEEKSLFSKIKPQRIWSSFTFANLCGVKIEISISIDRFLPPRVAPGGLAQVNRSIYL